MSRQTPHHPRPGDPAPPALTPGPGGLKNPEERAPAAHDDDSSAIEAFDEEGAGIAAKE